MDLAKFEWKQVEIEGTLCLRIDRDHITYVLRIDNLVYVVQVGGLATQADAVVDDLTIDLAFGHVYEGHKLLLSCLFVCSSGCATNVSAPCFATRPGRGITCPPDRVP